jgi:chromosome partitioning protein
MGKSKKTRTPVVAVLNMKGGVGKTTISANVFQAICEKRQVSTLLLDLDPQYNLSQLLLTDTDYDRLETAKKTILAALETEPTTSIFVPDPVAPPLPAARDIGEVVFVLPGTPPVELVLVPGDFDLFKYTLLADGRKTDLVVRRFCKFVDSAREKFGVICIDCNPSSSVLTLCALQACTDLLVPVRADRFSVQGLRLLTNFLSRIPQLEDLPDVHILLNNIDRNAPITDIERQLRSDPYYASRTLAHRLYTSSLLQADPLHTGFAKEKRRPWVARIEQELADVGHELATSIGM